MKARAWRCEGDEAPGGRNPGYYVWDGEQMLWQSDGHVIWRRPTARTEPAQCEVDPALTEVSAEEADALLTRAVAGASLMELATSRDFDELEKAFVEDLMKTGERIRKFMRALEKAIDRDRPAPAQAPRSKKKKRLR